MPLPRHIVRQHRLAVTSGILVVSVEPNGPAQRAGILPGDVRVGYAGRTVAGIDDLHRLLVEEQVGVRAPLTLLRSGELQRRDVVAAESLSMAMGIRTRQ